MNYSDVPVKMNCGRDTMLGIVSQPDKACSLGMVIVVGGSQYRVGSHRQFFLLARCLASKGYPVLRFDYRGMGDSDGKTRSFEEVDEDILTAVNALQQACPSVSRVVLWGLCDGASASLLYYGKHQDARLAGLCLLNPWVRSEVTLARTHIKHYYGKRLLQPEFWRKVWSGQFAWGSSVGSLWGNLRVSRKFPVASSYGKSFQQRMALALRQFPGRVLLILSACDYTAKEFIECAENDQDWQGLLKRPGLTRIDVVDADHTFSMSPWRMAAEQAVLNWMNSLEDSV